MGYSLQGSSKQREGARHVDPDAQTGLEVTVCHYPPGTSKWNKIVSTACSVSLR
jgi:hypothetical protein